MKKSTKIGIAIILISLLLIIVGSVFAMLVNDYKTTEENMEIIKETYTSFSVNIIKNYDIKKELVDKLNTFDNNTYSNEHSEYERILNNYDKNVQTINEEVNTLEEKCDVEYEDNSINLMCMYYHSLYETMNNEYVKYVTEYNNKITTYNETSEEDYKLYKLINTEYIDFNQDGKYESVEASE